MGASKYIGDDDEREKLLQTIPPGNVQTRELYGSESGILEPPEVYKSRWRSIRVMYLTMFLSSVSFSICMSSLYPYLKILDHTATTDFLGWVVAAYSVGQLIASPFFGAWSNWRKRSREPLIISLIINVIANVLYMYLESVGNHRAALLVVARAFVGFGAGNVAVVRSYVSGATTLKERTPAMANMSACQAVGFIIGPVIQTAMVPIGYPGPIHSPGLHLDMYTATALLSAIVGVINIVLLIVVFKEHTVPDDVLVTDIQGSVSDVVDETKEIRLDYVAVISSIALFFSVLFIFAVFETMATPLAMHMFAWTKSKATLLIGVMLGCAGVVSIVVFVFVKILSKRFNERYLLFGGFILCLVGFIIYLPWGLHYPDIQYADFTTMRPTHTVFTNGSTHYADITTEFTSERITYIKKNRTLKSKVVSFDNPVWTEDTMFENFNNGGTGATVDTTVNNLTTVVIQTTTAASMTTHKGSETTQHYLKQTSEKTTSHEKTMVPVQTTTVPDQTTTAPAQTTSVPVQTTTVPAQTTTAPAQTTSVPAQTTTVPAQTTSVFIPTGDHTTAEDATTEPVPTFPPKTENTTKEAVGCPYYYDWCFDTPAILLWQFLLGTFFVAVGYPVCNVMSYTIYSKILGPKPQGIWMGCLTAAGSLARTLGPVFVSQVYDAYGPRVTFISMCGLIILTVAGFLLVCRRLVPYRAVTTVTVH